MSGIIYIVIKTAELVFRVLLGVVKLVLKILITFRLIIPAAITAAYFWGIITVLDRKYGTPWVNGHLNQLLISAAVLFSVLSIVTLVLRGTRKRRTEKREEKVIKTRIKAQLMLFRQHGLDVNRSGYTLRNDGYFVHEENGTLFEDDLYKALAEMEAESEPEPVAPDEPDEPTIRGGYADEYTPEIKPDLYTAAEAELLTGSQTDFSLPDDIFGTVDFTAEAAV
jgi:hypothetical protein